MQPCRHVVVDRGQQLVHRIRLAAGEGLQHLAYEVTDFDASIAAFRAAGFESLLSKEGGTAVATYMDTRRLAGFFVELIRPGFRMRDPSTWPKPGAA